MSINKFRVRLAGFVIAVAGAGFAMSLGTADAAAAGPTCVAANGQQIERIVGNGGCGAKAEHGSRALAEEASGAGTAVAVADTGGNATARNLNPGSTALAGAKSRGTAYSVTTGPKAFSVAQARQGGLSFALGGYGGAAIAGPDGASCTGGFATALDSTTGKVCLKWGTVNLHN